VDGDPCETCWHYHPPGEGWTFAGDGLGNKETCNVLFLSYGARPLPPERTCKAHETRAEQAERRKREAEAIRESERNAPRCPTCGRKLR
jgi:hypothetical protein